MFYLNADGFFSILFSLLQFNRSDVIRLFTEDPKAENTVYFQRTSIIF